MSLLDDVSLMITPNGVAEDVLFGTLPQPIIGENILLNPTFDTSVPLGTNGSGWQKYEGGTSTVAFSDGGAKLTYGSGNCKLRARTSGGSEAVMTSGIVYKLTYEVISVDSVSNLFLYTGATDVGVNLTVGTHTTYFTADGTLFQFQITTGGNITLDNVYLQPYTSADMDFTRATTATRNGFSVNTTINPTFDTTINLGTAGSGWKDNTGGDSTVAYSNDGIHSGVKLTRVGSGACKLRVRNAGGSTSGMKIGSKYKLVYDVVENNGCTQLRYYNGASQTVVDNFIGTHTSYFTQTSTGTWQMENVTNDSNITLDNIYLYELLVEDVPRNLLEYSEDLTNSFWNAVNSDTIVASTIPSPDGATFGFKAIPNTSSAHHYFDYDYANVSLASTGSEVTYSVYVKPFGYTNFQLAPSTGFNSNSFVLYQNFELTGDGVKGTGNVNGATIEKIGDWYRCSITETTTDYSPRVLNLALPSSGLGRNPTFEGSGNDGVLLWGGQIEKGTLATAYIPTTDRLNVPRLDYTGGQCPHILAEPARTNICKQSEKLDGTSWTKQNVTVTANSTTSPDGTVNAEKVAKDGVSADDKIEQGISISNSTSYSVSAFLKNNDNPTGGKTTLSYRVNSGTLFRKSYEWTGSALAATTTYDSGTRTNEFIEDYGNGWYRVGFSFTSDGTAGDIEIDIDRSGGTSTTSIYVWGCQLEEGGFKTSYIPTVGSQITRNGEVFERTGIANLINDAEGVLYVEFAALADDLSYREISLSDGTNTNRVEIRFDTTSNTINAIIRNTSSYVSLSYAVTDITDFHKVAFKYKTADFALWVDGTERATDSTAFVTTGLNRLAFDSGDGTEIFYGKVRNLQVYKTALSPTQLGALTT